MHAGNVPAARSRSPRAFPRRLEGIEGAPNNARRSPRLASRLVPAAGRRRTSNSCGCSRPFPQAPPPAFPSRRRSPPPPSSLPRATSTSRARLGRDAPSATRDARLFRAPRSPRETERAPSERETRAKKGGASGAHGKRVDRRGDTSKTVSRFSTNDFASIAPLPWLLSRAPGRRRSWRRSGTSPSPRPRYRRGTRARPPPRPPPPPRRIASSPP